MSDATLMNKMVQNKDAESSDEDDSAGAIGYRPMGAQFLLKSQNGHMSNPEGPIRGASM